MNYYLFNIVVFDTAQDANLNVFPRSFIQGAVAETKTEAQRQIVDALYDDGGICAQYATDEDAADRFRIVFDDLECEQEVVYDNELGTWVFAEDDPPPEARARQKEWLAQH